MARQIRYKEKEEEMGSRGGGEVGNGESTTVRVRSHQFLKLTFITIGQHILLQRVKRDLLSLCSSR